MFRFGVLGVSHFAVHKMIPAMQAGGDTPVVAIASRDRARAADAARTLGIPRAYGSYEELLADPDIDGVYIGLPNLLHAEWTIKAAQAGKHVLRGKPHSKRAADADAMAAACEQAGVILMEAFMWRHHPQHAHVKALLAAGEIGEPTFVRASHAFAMDAARRDKPDVRVQPGLDGGSLMDIGCYPLNAARFLFDAEPIEVTAIQRFDRSLGVDTSLAMLVRFPGDRLALLDGSFDANGPQRYEISGFKGSIVVEPAFQPGPEPTTIRIDRGEERRLIEAPGIDQYGAEADHFVRSVRAGKLLGPAEDGRAQAKVIEALYRSVETGQTVQIA